MDVLLGPIFLLLFTDHPTYCASEEGKAYKKSFFLLFTQQQQISSRCQEILDMMLSWPKMPPILGPAPMIERQSKMRVGICGTHLDNSGEVSHMHNCRRLTVILWTLACFWYFNDAPDRGAWWWLHLMIEWVFILGSRWWPRWDSCVSTWRYNWQIGCLILLLESRHSHQLQVTASCLFTPAVTFCFSCPSHFKFCSNFLIIWAIRFW
jgi:hypothetical protein